MNSSDTNLENQNAEIKNSKKSNKGLIVILILIILGLGGYICYDKLAFEPESTKIPVTRNEETIEKNKEETKNENSDVPIEDTYAYGISYSLVGDTMFTNLEFYLLNNEKLYYKKFDKTTKVEDWIGDDLLTYDGYQYDQYTIPKDLTELKDFDNIKRIKGTNTHSNDVTFNILLITEKGEVYEFDAEDKEATRVKLLENYLVEDIIEFNSVNVCLDVDWTEEYGCGGSFKIILKNGEIIEKSY